MLVHPEIGMLLWTTVYSASNQFVTVVWQFLILVSLDMSPLPASYFSLHVKLAK